MCFFFFLHLDWVWLCSVISLLHHGDVCLLLCFCSGHLSEKSDFTLVKISVRILIHEKIKSVLLCFYCASEHRMSSKSVLSESSGSDWNEPAYQSHTLSSCRSRGLRDSVTNPFPIMLDIFVSVIQMDQNHNLDSTQFGCLINVKYIKYPNVLFKRVLNIPSFFFWSDIQVRSG